MCPAAGSFSGAGKNRHLTRVVRRKAGEAVTAVDGRGRAYDVRILKTGREETSAEILKVSDGTGERDADVTLAPGPDQGRPFRLAGGKGHGNRNQPLLFRSLRRTACRKPFPPTEFQGLKKIALSAMKQSGRSFLPEISPVATFERLLESSSAYGLRLVAHPDGGEGPGPVSARARVFCASSGPRADLNRVKWKKP